MGNVLPGKTGWPALICAIMLLNELPAQAAEPGNSSIAIEYGGDSQNTQDLFTELQLGLDQDAFVYLNGSRMEAEDEFSKIEASGYSIGFSSHANDPLGAMFEYGFWGKRGEIEISHIRAGFELGSDDVYFSIQPQMRNIIMTANLPMLGPREFDISSPGYSAQAGFYFLRNASLSAGFARNRYSADVTALATRPLFNYLLSPTTLSLSNGFEKTRLSVGLAWQGEQYDLGLDWLRSESAVDLTQTDIASLSLGVELSAHWQWTLRGGRQYPESGDETAFGSTGLKYRW